MLNRDGFRAIIERLDRKNQLDSLLLKFYQNMEADLMIGFFFTGRDLQKIASLQAAFIRRALGISREYVGRSPVDAHLGLPPILPGFFDRRLRILEDTLRHFGLEKEETEL